MRSLKNTSTKQTNCSSDANSEFTDGLFWTEDKGAGEWGWGPWEGRTPQIPGEGCALGAAHSEDKALGPG